MGKTQEAGGHPSAEGAECNETQQSWNCVALALGSLSQTRICCGAGILILWLLAVWKWRVAGTTQLLGCGGCWAGLGSRCDLAHTELVQRHISEGRKPFAVQSAEPQVGIRDFPAMGWVLPGCVTAGPGRCCLFLGEESESREGFFSISLKSGIQ